MSHHHASTEQISDCLRRVPGSVVELGEQILEHLERAQFAVHREGFAKGVADAGMDGRRSDLYEAP
jgi:ribosomal protein S4